MNALVKIGVSFAVEGPAADDCRFVNTAISRRFGSLVRFGDGGNSRPHVTVALGTVHVADLDQVIGVIETEAPRLRPFVLRFGPVAREHVTGGYVLADVVADDVVRVWRAGVREKVAPLMQGLGRTTSDPHLTLAVVEDHAEEIDHLLSRAPVRIADCTVTAVDVAYAGPKGAKGDLIQRFVIDGE